MKQNFYYADLDWNVDIDDGKSNVLASLSDNEVQALQLQVWQTISAFLIYRALWAMDAAEFAERMDKARHKDKQEQNGG